MWKTRSNELSGFCIDRDFFYHIDSRALIKFGNKDGSALVVITLRQTMANLFLYLLTHSEQDSVKDDDILLNVWELKGLKSSYQRLLQVIRNLKKLLHSVGIVEPLFYRTNSNAYIVSRMRVSPLYREVNEIERGTYNG